MATRRHPEDTFDLGDNFSLFKLLAHPEVLVAAQSSAPMRPINLEINPINICNQSCSWCTYGYLHERRERLDIDRIIAVLHDASDLGVQSVTWTGGGEPTVFKDLEQAVEVAVSLGFKQGINTNGKIMSPALRSLFVGHFSYVRFSVDAGSPAVYSRTHRVKPEDYDAVLANIAALCSERDATSSELVVGFSYLVDASNVEDVLAGARRARDAGVDYFQLKPIVHYERSNEQFASGSTVFEVLDAVLPDVFELENDTFEVRLLGHKFTDITKSEGDFGRTYETCRGNELLATIGADGSVDVCCAFKGQSEWSFGNVHDQSFRDIWDGPQRRDVLANVDVHKCPPLCKAHEMNKLIHFVNNFDAHREFP